MRCSRKILFVWSIPKVPEVQSIHPMKPFSFFHCFAGPATKPARHVRAAAFASVAALTALPAVFFASPAQAQTTVAYFSFNAAAPLRLSADIGTGLVTTDGTIMSFTGTTVNAQAGFAPGNDLAVQRGAGDSTTMRSTTFSVSTLGFTSLQFSFAAQRSAAGFFSNQLQYFDGAAFVNFGTAFDPGASYALRAFDLSGVSVLSNNASAQIRIVSSGLPSNAGAASNIRFDNVRIAGAALPGSGGVIPEPGTLVLAVMGLAPIAGLVRRRRRKATA